MLLCMSVNVRWNGRGWPGKVPRSPVASPEKAKEQGNWYGKDSRPKVTVKSRMAKNGNGKLKKKKKKKIKVYAGIEKPYGLSHTLS
jgi:hypothetical protein